MFEAFATNDREEALAACNDLIGWFERGGCWPEDVVPAATMHAALKTLRDVLAFVAAPSESGVMTVERTNDMQPEYYNITLTDPAAPTALAPRHVWSASTRIRRCSS
jgi:hypothetical protein